MYFSRTSTLAPAELSFPATANPPIPLPMTTASYSWSILIARRDMLKDGRRVGCDACDGEFTDFSEFGVGNGPPPRGRGGLTAASDILQLHGCGLRAMFPLLTRQDVQCNAVH